MKPMLRVVFALVIALGALHGAWAQAAPYLGTWMVDVQSSKRLRAMVVSQQGDVLRVVDAAARNDPLATLAID